MPTKTPLPLIVSIFVLALLFSASSVVAIEGFWKPNRSFEGPTGLVDAVEVANGQLYASGHFMSVNGMPIHHVARWDGTAWHPIGTGIGEMGLIHRILVDGDDVYIAGMMGLAGDTPVRNVAMWDGQRWNDMGGGTDRAIRAIVKHPNGDIYLGGEFTEAGGVPARGIARWDGAQWHALGSGIDNHVSSLAMIGNDLYVGGAFRLAGGQFANYVARWDGNEWHPLLSGNQNGVGNLVTALGVKDGELYVGGLFNAAGSVPANGIARWDGFQWWALGGGVSGRVAAVRAIVPDGERLYIGGFFTSAGEQAANYVAMWDGQTWSPLGSGTNNAVKAMARYDGVMYVGGEFTVAGGHNSPYFAEWHESPPVVATHVSVDIKPGSCENRLNATPAKKDKQNGKRPLGVVTVAVAGAEGFDVRDIDVSTVTLSGAHAVRARYDDVTAPARVCECPESSDGREDLVLKFTRADLLDALGMIEGESLEMSLAGTMLDGTALEGADCVRLKLGPPLPPGPDMAPVSLRQNHPNPFNPVTTIQFDLVDPAMVSLSVFDATGARVARLVEGAREAGSHVVTWDARNQRGDVVPSGIYFYRLQSGETVLTRKMILLK